MRHFPAGDALFFVDGVLAGNSSSCLDTDEGGFSDNSIFFGRDPLVTAEMKSTAQQSGREGFIDPQAYLYLGLDNDHNQPP